MVVDKRSSIVTWTNEFWQFMLVYELCVLAIYVGICIFSMCVCGRVHACARMRACVACVVSSG